jgi:translation elongation factor EF-Ts
MWSRLIRAALPLQYGFVGRRLFADVKVPMDLLKQLRERTGAPMTDCKNALAESGLDLNKAIDVLRKKGANVAAKSAGRAASRGLVGVASATDHKAACMVELNCETVRSQFNFFSFCQMFINYSLVSPF